MGRQSGEPQDFSEARESVFALEERTPKDPDAESDQAMRRAFGGCLGDKRR